MIDVGESVRGPARSEGVGAALAEWHPKDTIWLVEGIFPVPGSKRPYAVIRLVDVLLDGVPVTRWRAVTWREPRELLGYFETIEELAMHCHRAGQSELVPSALNDQRRLDQQNLGPAVRSEHDHRQGRSRRRS